MSAHMRTTERSRATNVTIIDDLLSIIIGKPVQGSVLDVFGNRDVPEWIVVVNRGLMSPAADDESDRPSLTPPG